MKNFKQKLTELYQSHNNNPKKSTTDLILLFIAEATAETNGNVKWLLWIAGVGITAGISILIALAIRSF